MGICGGCNGRFTHSKCGRCSQENTDSRFVEYTGPALACLDVETNTSMEDVILKIEAMACTQQGDYRAYDKGCLDDEEFIDTEAQFVKVISNLVCEMKEDIETLEQMEFDPSQIEAAIEAIQNPGLTVCAGSGITTSDGLNQILIKLATNICQLKDLLDISDVDWTRTFNTNPTINDFSDAFSYLLDRIEDIEQGELELPTFNNINSCLPAPITGADSLVSTVEKIKTKLCSVPTFDYNQISLDCIIPAQGNFQSLISTIYSHVNNLYSDRVTYDSQYFELEQTDPQDSCSGKTLKLRGSVGLSELGLVATELGDTPAYLLDKITEGAGMVITNIGGSLEFSAKGDHKVKATGSDVEGYLYDKLESGPGITIGMNALGEKVVIESTATGGTDEQVKVNSIDPTAGYLFDKIKGFSGITVSPSSDNKELRIAYTGSTLETGVVSVDGSDQPNFLETKLTTGNGISINKVAGKLVISSFLAHDGKVKVNTTGTAGFLEDKISALDTAPTGITLVKNTTGDKVTLVVRADSQRLAEGILVAIDTIPELEDKLCSLVEKCTLQSDTNKIDYDYDINGVRDGFNQVFQSSLPYLASTLMVFFDGVLLTKGDSYDFQVSADNRTVTIYKKVTDINNLTFKYKVSI